MHWQVEHEMQIQRKRLMNGEQRRDIPMDGQTCRKRRRERERLIVLHLDGHLFRSHQNISPALSPSHLFFTPNNSPLSFYLRSFVAHFQPSSHQQGFRFPLTILYNKLKTITPSPSDWTKPLSFNSTPSTFQKKCSIPRSLTLPLDKLPYTTRLTPPILYFSVFVFEIIKNCSCHAQPRGFSSTRVNCYCRAECFSYNSREITLWWVAL